MNKIDSFTDEQLIEARFNAQEKVNEAQEIHKAIVDEINHRATVAKLGEAGMKLIEKRMEQKIIANSQIIAVPAGIPE